MTPENNACTSLHVSEHKRYIARPQTLPLSAAASLQDATTPVLAVMLLEIVSALPPDLRICLLQLLPNLVLQMGGLAAGGAHLALLCCILAYFLAQTITCSLHACNCNMPPKPTSVHTCCGQCMHMVEEETT